MNKRTVLYTAEEVHSVIEDCANVVTLKSYGASGKQRIELKQLAEEVRSLKSRGKDMINRIQCSNCNKSGTLPLKITYTYKLNSCNECHRNEEAKWKYWFCDLECQSRWWSENRIEIEGFPCRSCLRGGVSTGFSFGFESNGACEVCNGTGRV